MLNQWRQFIELNTIKEEGSKRITKVCDLDSNRLYIKKELSHFDISLWKQLQSLNLSSIPHIFHLELDDNHLIVIEEFIEMTTLDEYTASHKIDAFETRKIILSLCHILKELHNATPSIIHRDIKPSNIFYDGSRITLGDFDIARTYKEYDKSKDTILLGSKGYAAPEHYGFGQTDQRSDIYSLGILYNYLLTGKLKDECIATGSDGSLINEMTNYSIEQRPKNIEAVEKKLQHMINTSNKTFLPNKSIDYTPPGFRKKKISHMIIASLSYLFLLFLIFSMEVESGNITESIIDKFFVTSWFVIIISFCTNYMDIYSHCLFKNNENRNIRIIGRFLTGIIIFIVDCIVFVEAYNLLV